MKFPVPGVRQNLERLIIEWNRYAEKKKKPGFWLALRARPWQRFDIFYDYDQLSNSLSESVNRLTQDWIFLHMFAISVLNSEAGNFRQKPQNESLIQSIYGLADEICRDIRLLADAYAMYDVVMVWPSKSLDVLCDCQRKTDELSKCKIRQALKGLSKLTFHGLDPDFEFWKMFLPLLVRNLGLFKDAGDDVLNQKLDFLRNELISIQRYHDDVIIFDDLYPSEIISVLYPLASVVLRIAVQSCNLWFNRTDPETSKVIASELVGLHKEIDPTNPEILELNLSFQKALYKTNSKRTVPYESAAIDHFCSYLLMWVRQEDLWREMVYVVKLLFIFDSSLEDGEEVHSFFAETTAVLGEAASFHRRVQRVETFPHPADNKFELLIKLFLLKAELSLKLLLNTHTSSMLFSDNQFYEVDVTITNLKAFTRDLSQQQGNSEYVEQSLALAEDFGNEIDSLHEPLHSKRISNVLVKHSLLQLLFKIAFFKAESFLTHLLKSTDTFIANEKDQIQSLVEELKYLKRIMANKLASNSSNEETLIKQVEAVTRGTILLSYSLLPENKMYEKIIHSLPQLLDKAKIITTKLREISHQFPKFIFPKTYELGFIDILGRNLREFLKHDPESIAPVEHNIEEVLLRLQSSKSFLLKVKDSDAEQGELKDLGNHIIEVAYKLEYVVESIEVDDHLKASIWLYDLLEDIRLVHQQVSTIHEMSHAGKVKGPHQIPNQRESRDTTADINEMLVDLEDEEKEIVERLTRGSLQRDVVSIVGMPGIGKTTLARKVYNNRSVMCHFRRRSWCAVSQTYSKRDLLLEILSHRPLLTDDNISQLTDDDLLAKLRRCLLVNKYLVVMDDMWDTTPWNDLETCFPDDRNGSRILITSRHRDVASKIKPGRDPHSIRPFSDVESWMLLEKKIFRGAVCPDELLEAGTEIAQHCQGLPLAVVAIAGLLQRIEKSKDSWKRVSNSISSEIIRNPENRCKEILELSYKHLPEYLKACFLYLGVFLEDKVIPVSKVKRFWMAEGFIRETESKSLEEVAEDYMLELINRSLVNVYNERSNGKAKTCRLHDLLRDLCHLKAKEENFLQLASRHDKPYESFPDSDYDMEFDSNRFPPPTFESYRLSFHLKRQHFIDSRPSGLGVRSLTFFASIDSEPRCPYDISFICHNFKLLRLLDLEGIMAIAFPVEIGLMVQLRYLAVSGYMQSIPPSIANLWRLETLVVKGLRGKIILPETIWSMVRLRHLRVNNRVAFTMHGLDEQVGSSFLLQNLVSFSTPSLSCGEDTLCIFKRLPNLRKLRCIFWQSWDSSEDCNGFPVLEFLTHLESLKIIYHGRAINSGEFVLPSNLKKLTLSKFCLRGNHLSAIGKLPCLRVLKLLAGAFEGQTWAMQEEEFKELTFLELDSVNIVEWNASNDHLPRLERLVLRNCKDLEAIPSDFADITTLKTIEVQWCKQSVVVSTEEIQEATEEIEVLIMHF